jgi:putative ABC transport system ATP-binding protein
LSGVNFILHRGEVWAVNGKNGSGKTTLLKIIAGQLQPVGGVITRHKVPLKMIYLNQLASEFVASALTVREQLLVGIGNQIPAFSRNATASALKKTYDILARYAIGLSAKLNTFTAELSGGQRQVVALVTALSSGADILLLDEYTSHMDKDSVAISNEILRNAIKENHVAIVAVEHGYDVSEKFEDVGHYRL